MKNDLTTFLYSQVLKDINKLLEILEYQPTDCEGFPTPVSFKRFRLIEDTLHKLVEELGVSDVLLDSFKVTKALNDDTSVPNFAEIFGKK